MERKQLHQPKQSQPQNIPRGVIFMPRDRQKRGDTHVKTIDLNVRNDMHLDTLRDRHNGESMSRIVDEYRKEK
jgi:hypothetical protein